MWADYLSARDVQPALFDPPAQPKRRKSGTIKPPRPNEQAIKRMIFNALMQYPGIDHSTLAITGVYRGRIIRPNGSVGFVSAGIKGMTDISGKMLDGRRLSIEVKTPATRNNVSPEQRQYIADELKRGDLAGVATSVEEAIAIVEGRA